MSDEHRSNVERMLENDAFSQWLAIEVISVSADETIIKMEIREEMTNGFGVAHGGIIFSLADSALAFASNFKQSETALALENNISFLQKVLAGDSLKAIAKPVSIGRRIRVFTVSIRNQKDEEIARFRGTVYRISNS